MARRGITQQMPGGNGAVARVRKKGRPAPELAFDPIEAALRELHQNTVVEEIPDDFLRLLDQLGEPEPNDGEDHSGNGTAGKRAEP